MQVLFEKLKANGTNIFKILYPKIRILVQKVGLKRVLVTQTLRQSRLKRYTVKLYQIIL